MAEAEPQLTICKYSNRVILKSILGQSDGGRAFIDERVVVGGWVLKSSSLEEPKRGQPKAAEDVMPCVGSRFLRSISKVLGGGGGEQPTDVVESSVHHKPPESSITILEINDGSCVASLVVTVESSLANPAAIMPRGTCIKAEGKVQLSTKGEHIIEVKADKIPHIGRVEEGRYPLSKKIGERHPLSKKLLLVERLRDHAHLRPRAPIVASVMRIRNALTQATHTFFQENEFLYVHAPIMTSTEMSSIDSKSKSELFQVTAVSVKEMVRSISETDKIRAMVHEIKAQIQQKERELMEKYYLKGTEEAIEASKFINARKVIVSEFEAMDKTGKSSRSAASRADTDDKYKVSEDFFSRKMFLTVSGRLHLESYAHGFGNVCSFGPRFQASQIEKQNFLSEEWKVEIEMAFSKMEEAIECASDLLKFVCEWILGKSTENINILSRRIDNTAIVDGLRSIAYGDFAKITYSEAVALLMKRDKVEKIEWGATLSEEDERYLTNEKFNKKPIIIYNHPKDTKPFYMRLNDDDKTVASFDLIVPKVGALIRGSENESRFDVLSKKLKDSGLAKEEYEWYLDLRRHGSVRCSGFTLLFDVLLLCATGLDDVRDVVPFPRSFGNANN